MDDRTERRSRAQPTTRALHVPFSDVSPGAVFVVGLAAYVKLHPGDESGYESANAVHMGTGRLHFFEPGFEVACPGERP